MDPAFWAKVHGATTHFPIAMIFGACLCDTAALCFWHQPAAGALRTTGKYAAIAAALGSVPAVISGLVMTHGDMLGHDALRWHHLFVWPAFALMIAAAVWRSLVREQVSRRGYAGYLGAIYVLTILIAATGYWGGEMLQTFP
ncbi:MAG TPA: DUF2231 domain-containing protein [Opitutaceae bacterium]|jgi:uncharacterized membrane protein|nr:DUF2231 domain-containing protein [Opitutaceae bacterium]